MKKTSVKDNNALPADYEGLIIINGEVFRVTKSATFSGVLHYGFCGMGAGQVMGWIPCGLCEIPSRDLCAKILKDHGL